MIKLKLSSKKDVVANIIRENDIGIMCMQEVDIKPTLNTDTLSIRDFKLKIKNNSVKRRVGIYVKNSIQTVRRSDLEGVDSNLIVLDVRGEQNFRLINVYRCFNPTNGMSAKEFFKYQLGLIKASFTTNTVLLGDFNIDAAKKYETDYRNKDLYWLNYWHNL